MAQWGGGGGGVGLRGLVRKWNPDLLFLMETKMDCLTWTSFVVSLVFGVVSLSRLLARREVFVFGGRKVLSSTFGRSLET